MNAQTGVNSGADFFARLVARAQGTAPLVQPLVRSRFDPADGGVSEALFNEEDATTPARAATGGTQPGLAAAAEVAVERPDALRNPALPAPGKSPASSPSPASPLDSSLLLPAVGSAPASALTPFPSPASGRGVPASKGSSASREAREDLVTDNPLPLAGADPPLVPLAPTAPPNASRTHATHDNAAQEWEARVDNTSAAVHAPALQQETSPETADNAAALSVAPTPSMPTVHVTIGRVEVRAVVEPTPAPVHAPIEAAPGWTPPRLSLDDYLRGRSGNGTGRPR